MNPRHLARITITPQTVKIEASGVLLTHWAIAAVGQVLDLHADAEHVTLSSPRWHGEFIVLDRTPQGGTVDRTTQGNAP